MRPYKRFDDGQTKAGTNYSVLLRVKSQVADPECDILFQRGAAQQCVDAGEQFLKIKRLPQIIIRTAVQTPHPVLQRATPCELQHRRPENLWLSHSPAPKTYPSQEGKHRARWRDIHSPLRATIRLLHLRSNSQRSFPRAFRG